MPELPEVENVGRALRENLLGQELLALHVNFAGVLGQTVRKTRAAIVGKTLTAVNRHGKYLILCFGEDGDAAFLMVHLRMTGQFFVREDYEPDKHAHLVFEFPDSPPVYYRDVRKFGRLVLVDDALAPSELAHVGPDMMKVRFKEWYPRIAHRKAPIKSLLLDQGIAAGLGNIYVDESLFLAGVHPLTRPCDLDEETLRDVLKRGKDVMRLAIKHGGTTFMNFTNFYGKPGNFKRKLRVYGRGGETCRDCKATLERIVIGGRSSVFCPKCQPEI
ncbi:MAG: formamidopyrimidine-DNA glycosylase [Candidatus Krumholzibacteriia bacterium]|jgi:formamidopyrimidine-DNA glycosylase